VVAGAWPSEGEEAFEGEEAAVVALGANLGDPRRALRAAAAALARLGAPLAASRLYRSPAVGGPPGQPDYLNAVLVLRPAPAWATPERLMSALLALEVGAGRVRRERWGPRVLDLDLIAFGRARRAERELVLPHPRAPERPFVMIPLAEAWPGWTFPDGRTAAQIAAHLPRAGLEATGEPVLERHAD
jgi:2-amino-4-hydroxy-6-hydroxymethyldihydropteridine diphosphokinase